MAKKIRFPLEMRDGIEVRDLESLKENFSLERILFYLADGKLETWLRDRYLDDIADAVSKIDQEDKELNRKICDLFEVDYMHRPQQMRSGLRGWTGMWCRSRFIPVTMS